MRNAESTVRVYSCSLLTNGTQDFTNQSVAVECLSERLPRATRVSTPGSQAVKQYFLRC
jgi:hypothetical protein